MRVMHWCSHKSQDFKGLCLLVQDRQRLRASEALIVEIWDPEHIRMKMTVFVLWLCVNTVWIFVLWMLLLVNLGLCVWLHIQARKHVPTTACVLERFNLHYSVCKNAKMHVNAKRRDSGDSELAHVNLGLCDCIPRCHRVCVTVHLLGSS